jgi:hypothetical protein
MVGENETVSRIDGLVDALVNLAAGETGKDDEAKYFENHFV